MAKELLLNYLKSAGTVGTPMGELDQVLCFGVYLNRSLAHLAV